jgi:hypothetical protein
MAHAVAVLSADRVGDTVTVTGTVDGAPATVQVWWSHLLSLPTTPPGSSTPRSSWYSRWPSPPRSRSQALPRCDSMDPAGNPLTEEHLKALDAVLVSCPRVMEIAAACQEAGLDVSDIVERCKQNGHAASVLKRKFFPDRP